MSIYISRQRGFKLVEIVIVASIIALLATVAIANVQEGRKEARDAQRMSDLQQIQVALRVYKDAQGTYPDYPWGTTIGEGGELDAILAPYLTAPIRDPLPGVPMDASFVVSFEKYSYIYTSDYDGCTNPGVGTDKIILYAKSMERDSSSNWDEICGGELPEPGAVNTYGVILK